jgi:hypothetical protein
MDVLIKLCNSDILNNDIEFITRILLNSLVYAIMFE